MRSVAYALALSVLLPASANAATLVLAGPASPYTEMVHNNNAPDGTSLTLNTFKGGYLVDVFSSDTLAASGSGNGFATITGPFSDLTIDPLSPVDGFTAIQFTLDPDGKNNLSYLFNIDVNFLDGTSQAFSTDFSSNNKFDILADGNEVIKSITFSNLMGDTSATDNTQIPYNFDKIAQISFDPVIGGVPEPTTWAMMLLGFGGIAASVRRRRRSSGGAVVGGADPALA
jgi:hypothetical protein